MTAATGAMDGEEISSVADAVKLSAEATLSIKQK
jgi:hypothetical protein